MIAEFGHFALILALGVALVQAAIPLVGAQRGWSNWMAVAAPSAVVQCGLLLAAFLALTWSFVTSDFSVQLVAMNSHSAKPMLYKITGVWGNHEGSMLLWVLILALFGATVGLWGGALPPGLKARALSVQAMIGVAFLLFILFTSNPFLRLDTPPLDGNDLNPLLQDPGLAFHPPFLYLGYVGLSMAFSFAVAALIEGRVDAAWARWVRPWTLAAWMFLTIGIALGSWWAYYELGWGGWWFWDPVENASFMPWLIAAALLHSAIVVEKRDTLKSWTILLAIMAFSFSLIGTFIVRSGVITSVHAFANDPERGTFILAILAVAIGGSLMLFALRAGDLRSGAMFSTISRESGLVMNNLLLTVSTLVVFIGTIWPLLLEIATGNKVSVGPPFFNLAFTPFMVALAVILPPAAMLPWKRGQIGRVMQPLWGVLALSVALGALIWALQTGRSMLAPVGIALALWVVLGALTDIAQRVKLGRAGWRESLRRAGNLPRADWGKMVAHAGFGLTMFGISAITAWEVEDIRIVDTGQSFTVAGYELRFDGVEAVQGPNYSAEIGSFTLLDGKREPVLRPEKRFYPVQQMPTTEAAINYGITRDVYVVLGDSQGAGRWAVRTYIKPFANWIWAGSIVMALGGILSLTDRRYRIGHAAGRKLRGAAVPAE
ncbi:heme lyase CcmF/NrfE family subunit [Oceanomicrobium pacificus]|uniref:Heme lyase CcmF/NrfE family subunit n=1 Tax=Oceanomicrobium pacificus TaxID=2692916 RepID=A0A6B0TZ43_9RHOB|nr:heme lyase CcmF/NrfE family subunit [Oceanomicrobium pacificus]MXU66294.1 heme lyase CcmF/NrfE family subunit [Oceanomicrobium pacificus]